MKKNILITGAEGFIARNLSKFLNKKNLTYMELGIKNFKIKFQRNLDTNY